MVRRSGALRHGDHPGRRALSQSESVARIAETLATARRSGRLLRADEVAITDAQAYDVQAHVHMALRGATPVVGYKLGYTSQVMRDAMGISDPNFGPLTQAMVMTSPARVGTLMQPKVEPELAVVVDRKLGVAKLHASLEVVDSVWKNYRFTWAHNTADGSSAAFAVIGAEIPTDLSLTDVTIEMTSSSGDVSVARVGDSGIDIEQSLKWLASRSEIRRELQPADIVLTGGLAAPLDLLDGGSIDATFRSVSWTTHVRVERNEPR